MSPPNSLWMVAVPNEGSNKDVTYRRIKEATSSVTNDYAEIHRFEIPELLVGTLDKLMTLSDDLSRVDMVVENIVRKIERQFQELNVNEEELDVDGVPVERYLFNFSWDEAKYPHQRPLSELSNLIQGSMHKVEEELKQLNTAYQEKKQALAGAGRKKGGSLVVTSLDTVLTPAVVPEGHFIDSEYLTTLVVVVPKALQTQFLESYEGLAADVASYGPPSNRDGVRGSPVVPGSAFKLVEEGEFVLFTVKLLKGRYQPGYYEEGGEFEPSSFMDFVERFKQEAREKRFIVRDFTYDPSALRHQQERAAQLEVEVNRLWGGVLRWCKAHFGEAFIAWMHIKAIKTFVESVLRFGVPVDYTAVIFRPYNNKEKKLRAALASLCSHLQGVGLMEGADQDDATSAEFFPYVWSKLHLLTAQQ